MLTTASLSVQLCYSWMLSQSLSSGTTELSKQVQLPSSSLETSQHVLDITTTETVTIWTLFLEQRAGDLWYLTHLIPAQNYKGKLKCSQHLVQENFFQTPDWQPKGHKILPNLVFAFYITPTSQTRIYSKFIMVNKRRKTWLLCPGFEAIWLCNSLISKPQVLYICLCYQ